MVEILLANRSLQAPSVVNGMARALQAGSVYPAVVTIEARKQAQGAVAPVIPMGAGLDRFDRPAPALSPYDELLEAR
jgi:hypothetical protein